MSLLLSVIIPAHNEERHIGRTLAALQSQTLSADQFEVILVDDRSSDRTVEIAHTFSALTLQVEQIASGSIGEVRNRGAAIAQADILLFLDADCVPRPDLLAGAITLAERQTLWGAHYRVPPDSTWVGRVWARFQATEQRGPTRFLPGGTLLIHSSDFALLGGFQKGLETSEDVELCRRAHQQGMQVLAFPELAVDHYGTAQTLASFYRQNRWHGKHVLRTFLERPSLQTGLLIGLSAYALVAFWCGLALLSVSLWTRCWLLAAVSPIPLLLAPAALAVLRVLRARAPRALPPLFTLYLVYLLARGAALVRSPLRGKRA